MYFFVAMIVTYAKFFSGYVSELLGLCVTMVVGGAVSTYSLSCKTAFENERTNHQIIQNCTPHTPNDTATNFKVPVHSTVRTHV